MINEILGIDLFEDYKNIPPNVQEILNNHLEDMESGEYYKLDMVLKKLEKIGYTFDYDLNGMPYDLRPIGMFGKSQLDSIH